MIPRTRQCHKNSYAKIDNKLLCKKEPDEFLIRAGSSVGEFLSSRYYKACSFLDKFNPRKINVSKIFSVDEALSLPCIDKKRQLNPYHKPKLIHQSWQKKVLASSISSLYYPYHVLRFTLFPFIIWSDIASSISGALSRKIIKRKEKKVNKKFTKHFRMLESEVKIASGEGLFDRFLSWREKKKLRKFMISPSPYITAMILALFVPKAFTEFSGDANDVRNIASFLQGFNPVNIEIDSGEGGLDIGPLSIMPKNTLAMQYNPNAPQMLHFNDSEGVSINGRQLAYIPSLKPAIFHNLGGYFYKMQDYEKSWLTSLDFARMDCSSAPIMGTLASIWNDKQIIINNKKEYDLSYQELEISYSPDKNQDSYYVSDYDIVDGKRVKQGVISCQGKGDAQFSGLLAHIANNISQGSVDNLNPSSLALNY